MHSGRYQKKDLSWMGWGDIFFPSASDIGGELQLNKVSSFSDEITLENKAFFFGDWRQKMTSWNGCRLNVKFMRSLQF